MPIPQPLAPFLLVTIFALAARFAEAEIKSGNAPLLLTGFAENCVKCHGKEGKVKGKVNLAVIEKAGDLSEDLELVRDLIAVLDFREMPPEEESPLKEETRLSLISELNEILRRETQNQFVSSGGQLRRMNRFQYDNAVRDLFQLNCVVFSLPERMMREHRNYFQPETGKMAGTVHVGSRPLGKSQLIEKRLGRVAPFPRDLRAEHGYDNQGDHLSLSPLLMEAFLKLSQSIVNSPDFHAKNVGIWKELFEAPENGIDVEVEVRKRLEPFLRRAFRRPAKQETLNRYVRFAVRKIEGGQSFSDGMKLVASSVLASPRFLYLYERDRTEKDHAAVKGDKMAAAATDFELASRLSFFLWGSIPDEVLLDLAADGELRKPSVLEAQFQRMLLDQKLKRFCDSFPSQWLQLDRIISAIPNSEKYSDFYFLKYRKSMHMMLEPLLLFETVLLENRPVTELIDPDFTYRSVLLNQFYGPGLAIDWPEAESKKPRGGQVTSIEFHRLPVEDRRVGGIITNAAVMTMTSGPERTKPITRGAWLAGVVFNNPPDPPPGDVPPLSEKPRKEEEHLTLRERLAVHRDQADCKGCHEQIDPLGFALENYDPVGRWRVSYENGREVDSSGTLFREREFADITEFKDAVLAEKDRFVRGLAGHLLSFALARKLDPRDQPELDRITEAAKRDNYRMRTILIEIIMSKPFRGGFFPAEPVDRIESKQ